MYLHTSRVNVRFTPPLCITSLRVRVMARVRSRVSRSCIVKRSYKEVTANRTFTAIVAYPLSLNGTVAVNNNNNNNNNK